MNERIKELEAQCWESRSHPNAQAAMGDRFNTEKFAELIVRECMMLCGAVSGASQVTRPNDAFGDGAEKCKALINQHFGVEE